VGEGRGVREEQVRDTVVGGSNKLVDVQTVSWRDVKNGVPFVSFSHF